MSEFSETERATILAGLQMLRAHVYARTPASVRITATDGHELRPLTEEEWKALECRFKD